jgi:hypothetical protein
MEYWSHIQTIQRAILKHHITNHLLTQWVYLHFSWIKKTNIESSINQWSHKDLQLPSHLL